MFKLKSNKIEDMSRQTSQKSEKIFSKLPEYGYSEKVAASIWKWYNPDKKAKPNP